MNNVTDKELKITEENGKEITLVFKMPDYEEIEEADQVYASKVASLIGQKDKGKLLMRQQLNEYLKESGVWTDKDEEKISKLQKEISNLLNQLRKGGQKASVGRKLCIDVLDKRREMVQIYSKRQAFEDITIESLAENEKNDYLVYVSTYYSDGNRYWESFDDMKNDKLSKVYRIASDEVFKLIYNITPDFEKQLPETRWLKKYGFIDDELKFVDRKTGKHVDRSGNPVEEIEKKVEQTFNDLQGEIKEEEPFLDDETNEKIIFDKDE